MIFEAAGFCPVCESEQKFIATRDGELNERWFPNWFRDSLRCEGCNSVPRERALAYVLSNVAPDWRKSSIHEGWRSGWSFSRKLMAECPGYVGSLCDFGSPFGVPLRGGRWRNEDLENQTFQDETFDIVIAQDVFKHLFQPGRAAREIARTLKPGGMVLMTVPAILAWGMTRRRASLVDGEVIHHQEAQLHGNPAGGESLVTIDWGYDIGAYLSRHSGMNFTVFLIDDMRIGVRDNCNAVLVGKKAPLPELGERERAADTIAPDPVATAKGLIATDDVGSLFSLVSRMPDDDPALTSIAENAAHQLRVAGRTSEVELISRRINKLHPTLPWPMGHIAFVEAEKGNEEAALSWLLRVNELVPNHAGVVAQLVAGLRRAGRDAEADEAQDRFAQWSLSEIDVFPRWVDQPQIADKSSQGRYLGLLERTICNTIYRDPVWMEGHLEPFSEARRKIGRDIPSVAHSMIGEVRLRQLRRAVETVIAEDIPGDLIETGAWRGGACILMKGVLQAYEDSTRRVFVADSFEGLPAPDPRYEKDALSTFDFHLRPELSVSREEVAENFRRYGLLDERVVFVEGFFRDTLPRLRDGRFAILRLDGDLYSSTMDALECLYDCVSPGGFIIVDDYGAVLDSRRAVLDFRQARGITAEMFAVDSDAVFWRKP